jgi:predicted HTH transcriptional regulator
MNKDQFLEIVATGREGRNLEFKRSMPWDTTEWKTKLVKSVLAFSNVRDGGRIIIGVEERDGGEFQFTGMTDEHFATYNQDDVDSEVAKYADPYARLSVNKVPVDERKFVVLEIEEFGEMPVICKRNGASNLRTGAIYTRPYGKAETVEVPSQTELREILELATDMAARKLIATMQRIGVVNVPQTPPAPNVDDQYNHQLLDLE